MDALIGHTGLVGNTLRRAYSFDALFRSTNIEDMRDQHFDVVVCAGARAEKWKANANPAADAAGIARLTSVLETVTIKHLILVSTIDVYPRPVAVDEATSIDDADAHAYGRNRRALESFCTEHFTSTIVRLPALFGVGLKKNVIFDLLHENGVDRIHPDSAFQFYDLSRLWADLVSIRATALPLVNLVTEPVAMAAIAEQVFGRRLSPARDVVPARYDVTSRFAAQFGGRNGYWSDADDTLRRLDSFVSEARRAIKAHDE